MKRLCCLCETDDTKNVLHFENIHIRASPYCMQLCNRNMSISVISSLFGWARYILSRMHAYTLLSYHLCCTDATLSGLNENTSKCNTTSLNTYYNMYIMWHTHVKKNLSLPSSHKRNIRLSMLYSPSSLTYPCSDQNHRAVSTNVIAIKRIPTSIVYLTLQQTKARILYTVMNRDKPCKKSYDFVTDRRKL